MAKQDTSVGRAWYAIHTYAGYENAVARNLRQRIESLGLGEKIFQVIVPTEKTVKIKGGRRVEEEEKVYPGYILVEMIVTDDSWYVVRNTPRVTGFVGSGQTPTPLTDEEVQNILNRATSTAEKPKPRLSFDRNESVRIVDGPFANFTGVVEEVDPDRGKLKISVSIFGRSTPVELEYWQVERA